MSNETPQQQVIYQSVVKQPGNGMAVTALILGILAIITGIWSVIPLVGMIAAFLAFLPALLAAIFGHVGLKKSKEQGIGRGQALTGLILGYITLAIIILTTIFWIIAMAASGGTTTM